MSDLSPPPLAEDVFHFDGFRSPRYTQVPDEAFDVLMARLTPAEFKVMMYIIRRTFGFHKPSDAISLRQIVSGVRTRDGRALDYGTGLSKAGAIKAIQGLVGKGVLLTERQSRGGHRFDATVYRLPIVDAPQDMPVHSVDSDPRRKAVHSVDSPSQPSEQPSVHPVDSQVTVGDSESEKQQHQPPVAAVASGESPTSKDLLRRIALFGIDSETASNLLAAHGESRLAHVLDSLTSRRAEGWQPRTTCAAWIVACLRHGYDLGSASPAPIPLVDREEAPPSLEPEEPHWYLPPGVSAEETALWQAVLAVLRAEGQWTAILAACFLRRDDDGGFTLLVPRQELLPTVADREEAILQALTAVVGTSVDLRLAHLDLTAETP